MSFTPTQYKAIALWSQRNNASPQLSTPLKVRFLNKTSGEISEVPMTSVLREYENAKKEIARERARAKREERRR